jgi:uncharacterized protein (TIGR03790 family)
LASDTKKNVKGPSKASGAKFLTQGEVFAQMKVRLILATCLIIFSAEPGYALEPDQILVIANRDVPESVRIARHYCAKRAVPVDNILALPLGTSLSDRISRKNYEKQLAGPIRNKLNSREFAGKIRCLLMTYGVPIKVGGRGQLKGQEDRLEQLKKLAEQGKNKIEQLEQSNSAKSAEQKKRINRRVAQLQFEIDRITGKETNASVDSELSMVLFDDYELYQWQPNKLTYRMPYWDFKSLMVCRLDGPGKRIAQGLIDKAIVAEQNGLKGVAYIDSGYPENKKGKVLFAKYNESLRDLALMIKTKTQIPVVEERTDALFAPGQCPSTVLYCGWYSLKKYVDAFDFVDGAIGYHIASLEAANLRDPNSNLWCPAMLKDGVTATLGAVAEPYLHSFPKPKAFFAELFNGRCLVEAYYLTKPFNSWQLVLIGDPLYTPFKKPQGSPSEAF